MCRMRHRSKWFIMDLGKYVIDKVADIMVYKFANSNVEANKKPTCIPQVGFRKMELRPDLNR